MWFSRVAKPLVVVLVVVLALGASTLRPTPGAHLSSHTAFPLAGQITWKDGASSLLFGTTDSIEYSPRNIETLPEIPLALKSAGFTWLRTFIPDNSSDVDLERRIATVEATGGACMGVILDINNTVFLEHVVRLWGDRCQMYEFGGEPDYNNIRPADFLRAWNTEIPVLRRINPHATFFGPTTGAANYAYIRTFLEGVKASGVLPDAISIDYYACNNDSRAACLAKAADFGTVALNIRGLVRDVLGRDLPVGFTEWNYDPNLHPPAYGDDPSFISEFSRTAIRSMVEAGVTFAAQYDVASYSGYGRLDMFDTETGQPKPQFKALADLIEQYRSSPLG